MVLVSLSSSAFYSQGNWDSVTNKWVFPGGPVVKNPSYNAVGAGLIPCQGTKIPHAAGQLGPRATTTEPMRPGACAPQLEKRKPERHN